MIFNVYCVRDVKTGFLTPTIEQNDECAIRNFRHACLNTQSLFFTSAIDYALYRVGVFDSDTGDISSSLPMILCEATDFVRSDLSV